MYYFEENEYGYKCKSDSVKELKKMIEKHCPYNGRIYKGNQLYALVSRNTMNFQGQKYYEFAYERVI